MRTLRGGRCSFELSRELSGALVDLSRREGVTLFMTLLAAFVTLLRRYSDEDHVTIGTPVVTRTYPGTEALVGCFMNTLAIRVDFSGDPTFRELLRRVQDVTVSAYAHHDLPFEQVVEAVQPRRDLGSMPLFQSMLVVHTAPMSEPQMPGLTVSPVEIDSGTALFDLMMVVETGERLHGWLEYSADLFDAPTAAHILEQFESALEGVASDPDERLSSLSFLGEADRRRMLVEWNDTAVVFPQQLCLHELFEAQVEQSPHAVAVVFGNQALTYGELNRRANQLANHLREMDMGPEVLVGLYLEPSLEMVVGALGVLKAGGAFVPLDPSYPWQRLAFMLEDAQPHVLLTQQRLVDSLPVGGASVIRLDTDWDAVARESDEQPSSNITPEHLAYVMYTSGSTGVPKGVMISHRGIVNQLCWRQAAFPLSETDAVLQRTPCSADPSIWEFFGPLSAGARLVVPGSEEQRNAASVVRLIAQHNITTLQVVPSLLRVLLEQPGFESCRSLERIFCGGEALTFELQEDFFARCAAELHNLYGPTEASIDTTHWPCGRGTEPCIGHPISNVKVYILDAQLQPVPIGVPGELYLGGPGLARGYLNRPELTVERFMRDPFSDDPRARLYRTGDLARYRPDGAIEFLGRADDQVKIRGFRVEAGEIEAALAQHPMVRQAAVVAHEDIDGSPCLIAYVVADRDRRENIDDLRRLAKESLPDYMVPSGFLLLDVLPLLPSGKVDRRALPPPEEGALKRESVAVAPRDPIELQLVHIWESFFDHHQIGITDDFFELGGHSLLAMRLVARVQQVFGLELPLAAMFQGSTIERLARVIRDHSGKVARSPVVAIQPDGSKRPFFCVHPTGGSVFCYVELSRQLGNDRPFYGVQAPGLEGECEPLVTIEDMARHYIDALQGIQPEEPYELGGWSLGGLVAFEMARQLVARGEQVATVALVDAWPPLSVSGDREGDWPALLDGFIRQLGLSMDQVARPTDTFWRLDTDEQLACVLDCARHANLVPADMDLARLRRQVHVFAAHLQAVQRYVPQPYAGRVSLFKAADPPAALGPDSSPSWENLALRGIDTMLVPGNHYTMLREPNVRLLARHLAACLDGIHSAQPRG